MVPAFKGDISLNEGIGWCSVYLQQGMHWLERRRKQCAPPCPGWSGESLSSGDTRSKGGAPEMCHPWARYLVYIVWCNSLNSVMRYKAYTSCLLQTKNQDLERLSNLPKATHLVGRTALYSS